MMSGRSQAGPTAGSKSFAFAGSAIVFFMVALLATLHIAEHLHIPGSNDRHRYALQDFHDIIYYPIQAVRSGINPYASAPLADAFPVKTPMTLYSPLMQWIHLPFGYLPLGIADALYVVWMLCFTLVFAWLCLKTARCTITGTRILLLASLIAVCRSGETTLVIGQNTLLICSLTLAAIHYSKNRPWIAAIALALATAKPTFGVPLAILMLFRGDSRIVARAAAIAAIATGLAAIPLLISSGGIAPFLQSVIVNYAGTQSLSLFNASTSAARIDAMALLSRVVPPTSIFMCSMWVLALILGIAGVALRWARAGTASGRATGIVEGLTITALLTGVYHMPYDAILLTPLILIALKVLRRQHATIAPGHLLLVAVMAVPLFNYLDSRTLQSVLEIGSEWKPATALINRVAIATAYIAYLTMAIGTRRLSAREQRSPPSPAVIPERFTGPAASLSEDTASPS